MPSGFAESAIIVALSEGYLKCFLALVPRGAEPCPPH